MPARVQAQGATADSTTSVSIALSISPSANNVLVVEVAKFSNTSDPFVEGDISQSAGTATLGSFTLDRGDSRASGSGFIHSAIYSVPVTATGTCTIQVAGGVAATFWFIAVSEYTDLDTSASRVVGANGSNAASGAPNTGTVAASTIGTVFVGIVGTGTAAPTTHTPGPGYVQIAEEEDGANHMTGNAEDLVANTVFTAAATWSAPTADPWVASLVVYRAMPATPEVILDWGPQYVVGGASRSSMIPSGAS